MMNNFKQVFPNALTVLRMISFLLVIIFLAIAASDIARLEEFHYIKSGDNGFTFWIVAGAIFTFSAVTDFLDGYLARKWNVVSTFGKFFDPIADKLLINLTLIVMAYYFPRMVPIYIVVIFIMRDTIVDASRMFLASKGIILPAHFSGKLKTVWQMIAILILFFVTPFIVEVLPIKPDGARKDAELAIYITQIPLFISALFSIISGFHYGQEVFKYILTNVKKKPKKQVAKNKK
ncbi:CDP-diacylglycerol--glycerol-3-phosphate 3-phosphatidyltransferase [Mycoplasma sp. (ex Biomphalaria glabrata)]|uniref:CDP-diacylglycerol--glycerol-3-phosphate 3-phosphatidyltransferase n=1 Tax=Mycoplasma sp. (ex Biomphalaria glabrata) TaxID=1749074 RepID=UPI000B073561|nr:CDP-diacylglycerol--glycerol-3-phosphate 3-phosphatidyltransferase [Mycoplasma sp. (ex Biomphalaria glabrata)]